VRDAANVAVLRADAKSQHEHALVRDAIVAELRAVSSRVACEPEPRVLSLGRVHHLHTPIEAELERPQSLLARLHPTPAVCGTPQGLAEDAIARLEAVDRGLYAGAIGWWRADGESVGVALRCAQYAADSTTLFLGAGIVEGSAPEAEHDELDSKAAALTESWTERAAGSGA
jgi:isochorismate synthase